MLKTNQVEKIKVWERGQITLPKSFREELKIGENDILYIEKLGDGLYLRSKEPVITEIQKKGEELMKEKGLTMKDLLKDLIDEEE